MTAPFDLVNYLAELPCQDHIVHVWKNYAGKVTAAMQVEGGALSAVLEQGPNPEDMSIQAARELLSSEHGPGKPRLVVSGLPQYVVRDSIDDVVDVTTASSFPSSTKSLSCGSFLAGQGGTCIELGVVEEDSWVSVNAGQTSVLGKLSKRGTNSNLSMTIEPANGAVCLKKGWNFTMFLDENSLVYFCYKVPVQPDS
ncbi:hypothetical protein BKA67DRAFT_660975 [Truncatella angustata]|uniref:Uncharacterized protein n=1 Tax=Truncatella angustata TaxID=152316 RepID=A0A9P8UHD2_9PEZI|nr:uncharacterized protein BKA67DRAFT_660975 [Truncatella angustata]KAH6652211.1 hypothetical protein BKA67DRAFT_660975 [Truncatella angustata]KAH8196683.1 hypothetical protein TruAng_009151 [Truncatella angustata]